MKKQQIDIVAFIIDSYSFLSSQKCKIISEFRYKVLKV